ncbi:SDR family NAD(P)-dependent oxidoreductase [Nocardia uniformis]|uniref:SDR family NAD(P)-dependent oxidoreductase n=1 Tax=Nocardia uniformis TaxID=53432 RepID=A0A849C8S5_9NOCA|nr:SDR family NAD(P)-dependent oxidoreductase [Nocardia uniformis]NNH72770.1 SDR family NAD(P)-dependent oxidoreductase [Nocardia uniformis]
MKINTLHPKLVVVTGAGSGIGRAIALRFANRGAHVVVSDIDLNAAEATVAMIRGKGNKATAARLDVTDPQAWESFARDVHADHGVPDVLVNNAGMVISGAFVDLAPQDWDRQLGVNLMGVIHGCRVVGKQMIDRGQGGHIINIASAAAFTPTAVMSAYSVSKAGVKMLSECLRLEFAPHGIGVSAICPGVINTNIGLNGVMVGVDDATVERSKQASVRIQELAAKLPFSPLSPNLVARAATRALRYDLAVVPVRAEAWLGYFLMRVAPGINRNIARYFTVDALESVAERAMKLIGADMPAPTSKTEPARVEARK